MNNECLLTIQDAEIAVFDGFPNLLLCVVHGFSERDEYEMQSRGWLGYVYLVDFESENYWPLNFYDTVRITQDTAMTGYTEDIGLIVMQELTLKLIIDTCHTLLKSNYTTYHRSFTKNEIKTLYCLLND